jgi:hypothetical protein
MKWLIAVSLISLTLLITTSPAAVASEQLLSVSCDGFLGVRVGIESRFDPQMGIRADLGAAIFGLFLADAFFVLYLLPEEQRFRLNLLLGIPTASAPMTLEAGMVALGMSLAAGYRFTETFSMDLRLGAGFPFFFERGKDIIRPVKFPFFIPYLWPDLVLGFNFALKDR